MPATPLQLLHTETQGHSKKTSLSEPMSSTLQGVPALIPSNHHRSANQDSRIFKNPIKTTDRK